MSDLDLNEQQTQKIPLKNTSKRLVPNNMGSLVSNEQTQRAPMNTSKRLAPRNSHTRVLGKRYQIQNVRMFGKYQILKEIGRGNMGLVFLAKDPDRNKNVALKIALHRDLKDQEQEQRFFREAGAMQRLNHPNIIKIYDVGKIDQVSYFTMEYISGGTLKSLLETKKISIRRATEIMSKLSQALKHAHEKNIIHRDIKPENIMMKSKDPILTDFGLARPINHCSKVTKTGSILGTPAYMPPEQARGVSNAVDEISDIYSLGATFYHILTGQPPFTGGGTLQVLSKVVNTTPALPSTINSAIPKDLDMLCLKALEKDKIERFQSSAEIVKYLDDFIAGAAVDNRAISQKVRRSYYQKIQKKIYWGLGCFVLAAIPIYMLFQIYDARQEHFSANTRIYNIRQVNHKLFEIHGAISHPKLLKTLLINDEETTWNAEGEFQHSVKSKINQPIQITTLYKNHYWSTKNCQCRPGNKLKKFSKDE